jgi:hypothetical protein
MQAYRAARIPQPRNTYDQAFAGQPVYDLTQLVPGDLWSVESFPLETAQAG